MNKIPMWMRVAVMVGLLVAMALMLTLAPAKGEVAGGHVAVTEIEGAIGVAAAVHACEVIEDAARQGARAVVIRLDTPGGLLSATRDLVQCILGAKVPVAVHVAPSGARAASAGTYIAMAAHVAAMAPGTHIGAATPIALGLPSPLPPAERRRPEGEKETPSAAGAAERKAVNDSAAYLKSLAELHGRNAVWAEKAVREAATLTADEAVRERVVDIIAQDTESLLRAMHGRTVTIAGESRLLATAGARSTMVEPNWRMRLLAAVSDPNVAFILLMLGVYGILFELWNPGALLPGVIGGVSLLLGLTALSVLPLNYGGLALVLLGLALMAAEAFLPGFGILGIGGLVSFVVGAIFLFDPKGADFDIRLAWPVIAAAAATSALLSAVVLATAVRARARKPATGSEEMIDLAGEVVAWNGRTGRVRAHGEIWSATADRPLTLGERIRVRERVGLVLHVVPEAETAIPQRGRSS